MTTIRIDMTSDDTSRYGGGAVGWGADCSLEDASEMVLHVGSIDIAMTGSGKDGGSSRTSKSSSQSVSPVMTSFTPTSAQMSPE